MGATGGPRQGHELAGKRLGLLGFGRAAKGVAVAAGALGMQVHAYSHAQSNSTSNPSPSSNPDPDPNLDPNLDHNPHPHLSPFTLAGARLLP